MAEVIRLLNKNNSVKIEGKTINVNVSSGTVGNSTWGKIDYLVNNHNYHVNRTNAPVVTIPNKTGKNIRKREAKQVIKAKINSKIAVKLKSTK